MCRARLALLVCKVSKQSSMVSETALAVSFHFSAGSLCVGVRLFFTWLSRRCSLLAFVWLVRGFYGYGQIRPYSVPVFRVRLFFGWQQLGSRRFVFDAAVPWSRRSCRFSAYLFMSAFFCFLSSTSSAASAWLSSFVSVSLLACGFSVMALLFCFCGAAQLRALAAALARGFGDSDNTGANVPTHGTTRRCTRPFTASLFSAVASPRGCKRRVSLVVLSRRAAWLEAW